ncbi:MAG TPA: response regulator [Bryobacteraceae bacterium]|nr:response regulator [Bryobacteraceae bacterium]
MRHDSAQTVLVVDDHTPVRRLIIRMLGRCGFKTLEAGTGAQALALFQDARATIDLAIIDMLMPNMSGLDVAAELGRQYPEVKILYLSGHPGSIAIDCIRRRAPEHLLLKPFTEQSLVDRVSSLLARDDHQTVSSASEPV